MHRWYTGLNNLEGHRNAEWGKCELWYISSYKIKIQRRGQGARRLIHIRGVHAPLCRVPNVRLSLQRLEEFRPTRRIVLRGCPPVEHDRGISQEVIGTVKDDQLAAAHGENHVILGSYLACIPMHEARDATLKDRCCFCILLVPLNELLEPWFQRFVVYQRSQECHIATISETIFHPTCTRSLNGQGKGEHVPGSLPAAVTPFFSNISISRMSRSAARISGSSSARNASSSVEDIFWYVGGGVGRVPERAKEGVRRCPCCSSNYDAKTVKGIEWRRRAEDNAQ